MEKSIKMVNILKKLRIQLLGAAMFLMPTFGIGQDIQYSQFYANVLYLNPAFAGSAHASRGIFHQRVQWPALDAKYITSHFSLDHYNSNTNSGLGFMVFKDWQGSNTIATTEVSAQYAYELPLSSTHSFRFGIQGGYVSRHIDYSMLRFPDQYDENGYHGSRTHQPTDKNMIQYLDLTSGGLLYSDKYWIGFSYAHMNRPNQSFYGDESRLPSKFSYVAGYRISLEQKDLKKQINQGRDIYLSPTIHYKSQGKSDQVDVGAYFLYDYVITGVWYRGIPLLKRYRKGLHNNESMVVVAGFKINNKLSVSYSFDFTVSKLARANTGGSHEINITYLHNQVKKKKKMRKLPCPKF